MPDEPPIRPLEARQQATPFVDEPVPGSAVGTTTAGGVGVASSEPDSTIRAAPSAITATLKTATAKTSHRFTSPGSSFAG